MADSIPRSRARMAGAFYTVTFLAGTLALVAPGLAMAANMVAGASYVVVTILFYFLFRPVNGEVALLAAIVSLAGCVWGVLTGLKAVPVPLSPLVFFGVYCLMTAWLIARSNFLPRVLAVLLAIGGIGWLTFASPTLSGRLFPWNLAPGMLGEGVLTLWLLVRGVDEERWCELSRSAGR